MFSFLRFLNGEKPKYSRAAKSEARFREEMAKINSTNDKLLLGMCQAYCTKTGLSPDNVVLCRGLLKSGDEWSAKFWFERKTDVEKFMK